MQVNDEGGAHLCRRPARRSSPGPRRLLVGEIRDPETAQIAIESALTGHLVLSTLHTNDAPMAPARSIDMGCEPFLVASRDRVRDRAAATRRLCPE